MIVTREGKSQWPALPLPDGSPPPEETKTFFDDCESGNAKGVARYLQRWPDHADIQWCGRNLNGMMLAANKGHNKVIRLLIDAGCDVNTRDADGNTALFCALYSGRLGTAKLLLDKGTDISLRPIIGKSTALMAGIHSGNEALVRFLLQRGEKADERDEYGGNSLSQLRWCRNPDNDFVPLLVQHGADINAKSRNGSTPLSEAAQGACVKTVRQLLDLGAEVDLENMHPVSFHNEEIARMLRDEPGRREDARTTEINDATHGGLKAPITVKRLRLKHAFSGFQQCVAQDEACGREVNYQARHIHKRRYEWR